MLLSKNALTRHVNEAQLANPRADSLETPQQWRRAVPQEVWWILFIGAALRLIFFFVAENNGGDALARAAMTAGWLEHPSSWLNFEPWLPMHFWLMAGMSVIVGGPGIGARMLSFLL